MTLPIVFEYHSYRRQPLECLCVECGAIRPTLDIPKRIPCTGLKPALYAALASHDGVALPKTIHEPIVRHARAF